MSRVSQSEHEKQKINTQSKTKLREVELDNVSAASSILGVGVILAQQSESRQYIGSSNREI